MVKRMAWLTFCVWLACWLITFFSAIEWAMTREPFAWEDEEL